MSRGIHMVGIPARQNRLLIVDVDVEGPTHKHDGREWWANFCHEYGIPTTYSVQTPSGGYHFYFRIPEHINLDTFKCPAHPIHNGSKVLGVDFKYNGWVGSPPSPDYYVIAKNASEIEYLPPSFLAYISQITQGTGQSTFDGNTDIVSNLYKPFTHEQIEDLKRKIDWMRLNVTLSRDEWRDGIFSLKAGCDDEEDLEELVTSWTMNQSYVEGDEREAMEMAERADRFGSVGPGTIFSIIKEHMSKGATPQIEGRKDDDSPWTRDEIFSRAQIVPSFDRQGNVKVEPSESNAAALIGAIYDKNSLYFDSRNDLYIYNNECYSDTELTNKFLPLLQSASHGLGLEKFRASIVSRGLDILMSSRQIDPHKEFLKSLKWDGVSRIETFFIDHLKVEDNEYHRIAAKNFWVALAARGLKPGSKFDSVLVIEGSEGIRKSSLVEVIGGRGYTHTCLTNRAFEDIDELRKMHQSTIVELPELIGLVNRPAEMVKGFLSTRTDSVRDLYARRAKMQQRSFVFVGTTNSDQYLSSNMGLRRFWPIRVPKQVESINTEAIEMVRDQLYAEAIQYFRDGYKYWHMPHSLLEKVTAFRVMQDPLVEAIKECVNGEESISIVQVYKRLVSIDFINKGLDLRLRNRIETSLKTLGYHQDKNVWFPKVSEEEFSQPEFMTQYNNLI